MLTQFLITVLLLEITPGPNLGYLTALSATRGRRAGLAATAGVACGLAVHALAAAYGVSAVIARSTVAYELLRWAGVGFLAWLAWETWQGERETSPAAVRGDPARGLFWRGFWTNVFSPKSALFFIAVVPRFLDAEQPGTRQLALLGAIYVAVATAVHAGVVVLAARAEPWLAAGGRQAWLRRGLAVVLLAIAVWLAWDTQR
jgi:threonine/homoserine/homoserine lactone efflux protein